MNLKLQRSLKLYRKEKSRTNIELAGSEASWLLMSSAQNNPLFTCAMQCAMCNAVQRWMQKVETIKEKIQNKLLVSC